MNDSVLLVLTRSKYVTTSDILNKLVTNASGAFSPYKFSAPSLRISLTHCTSTLTNINRSNIQLFHFFKMIQDLNYYSAGA
jgi:hypothetical protein